MDATALVLTLKKDLEVDVGSPSGRASEFAPRGFNHDIISMTTLTSPSRRPITLPILARLTNFLSVWLMSLPCFDVFIFFSINPGI